MGRSEENFKSPPGEKNQRRNGPQRQGTWVLGNNKLRSGSRKMRLLTGKYVRFGVITYRLEKMKPRRRRRGGWGKYRMGGTRASGKIGAE